MSGSSLSSADPKDFIVALNHAFLEDFHSAAAARHLNKPTPQADTFIIEVLEFLFSTTGIFHERVGTPIFNTFTKNEKIQNLKKC